MVRTPPTLLNALAVCALALLLSGCSLLDQYTDRRPATTTNICRIFEDRPHWYQAAEQAEDKWGVPVPVQMAIIWRESGFRQYVRPPRKYLLGVIPWGRPSSSVGFTQAVDGTWDWYMESTGNDDATRDDFFDSTDFVGWYVNLAHRQNGIDKSDAYNNYLAYHEGHAGYRRGSWRDKPGVQQAAGEVRDMAERYDEQLRSCRGRLG